MSELISRNDAAQAFISGKQVEFLDKTGQWRSMIDNTVLKVFLDHTDFRLKPRTITINGIEVPAPFEPKNGEDFYYLDCTSDNYGGWAKTSWRNVESDSFKNNTVFGAWRTEEEIKQVVSALHSVFKCGV